MRIGAGFALKGDALAHGRPFRSFRRANTA
jgi:hypothetical protein